MASTNDQNTDNEFPGYPHYPAKEDIMNVKGTERIELDVESLSRSKATSSGLPGATANPSSVNEDSALLDADDVEKEDEPNDADITADDLIALGEEDINFETIAPTADNDLDVPGAEEDNANEEIGEEDEENNYYSLGGEAHENLEEDREG